VKLNFLKIPEEISTDAYHISYDFEKRRQAKSVVYEDLEMQLKISAIAQLKMSRFVGRTDSFEWDGQKVIGVDVSYDNDIAFGCAIELDIVNRSVTKRETHRSKCEFPYIPGHFYLREGPIVKELLRKFEKNIVLIDGNGILHPRRFGLASYVGVILNIPTIGVAKSLLLGDIGDREEDYAFVTDDKEVIGAAVWLGSKKKPVYVSIGHKVSLTTAIAIVRETASHGNPEPLRQAHICSRDLISNL
jgi:deoxyribonuclease V